MNIRSRTVVTCIMALLLVFSFALGASAAPAATVSAANCAAPQIVAGSQCVPLLSNTGSSATEQACYPAAALQNQLVDRLFSRNAAAPSCVKGVQGLSNSSSQSGDAQLMIQLINKERSGAGVPALQENAKLAQLAGLKALDMVQNNYYGHTSPTYGSLGNMLQQFGVECKYAGENLALSTSVARAHAALMKSSGNRANIVSAKYNKVGVGIATKGSYVYVVEIFTGDGTAGTGGSGQPPQPQPQPQPQPDPNASSLNADEQKMLDLVNAERVKAGLSPLKVNLKLAGVARLKAKDMIDKNYFSHTSPTYGSPFDMMKQFGISYYTAGENLAGAPDVNTAHTNLMNSSGHRANILNSSFKEVGIGIVNGGPYGKMFVQMFIG